MRGSLHVVASTGFVVVLACLSVTARAEEQPVIARPPAGGAEPCEIPRIAVPQPEDPYQAPTPAREGKRLWATSYLWSKAPDLVVEKWLNPEPDTEGKYLLIEFWATWCPPCRRSLPLLNDLHERYADELVVIGISEETEEDVRALKEPSIAFFSAIDTQQRMKKEMGVWGIPHTIIVEPGGHVVWEGFPLLDGYELTPELVDKILAVGRRERQE